MKTITSKKHHSRRALAFVKYDFEIENYFIKINSVNESLKHFDYEEKIDGEIGLFILQNKFKNIIVIIINLTFYNDA